MPLFGVHMTNQKGTAGAGIEGKVVQVESDSLRSAIAEAEQLHPGHRVVRGSRISDPEPAQDLEAWMAARSKR